jgi:hypothetical protein
MRPEGSGEDAGKPLKSPNAAKAGGQVCEARQVHKMAQSKPRFPASIAGTRYTVSRGMAADEARICKPIATAREVGALQFQIVVDPNYRPCMVCDSPGNPKTVLLGFGVGVEVRLTGTAEFVGYLHANCRDAWMSKNDGAKFSFKLV